MHPALYISLVLVLAILVLAYWAYHRCWLNSLLPADMRKMYCPTKLDTFVGAMANTAPLVPCAFPETGTWVMNRCNYA